MAVRRRLPAAQRREQLLDAAAAIVIEDGFEALTMEAVKDRAKVSRGLTYLHFENTEDLAFALYDREANELDRRIAATRDTPGAFEDRVKAAMGAYLDFASERGGLMAILQLKLTGRYAKPSVQEQLGRRFRFWAAALETEMGLPADVAGALARASVAAAEGFVAAWRANKLSRRDAETMGVAFALGGLKAAVAARKKK